MKPEISGLFIILIMATMCLCTVITAPASAQNAVIVDSFTPLPNRANLTSRYEVVFTTSASGALTAGTDAIRITFPDEVRMPSSIEENHVLVNGSNCSEGGVFLDDRTLVITPPNDVAADSKCTVIIIQNAGIANPRLSEEIGDGAPNELYVLTVATDKDTADMIQYEIFDWVGASPTELAHHDPCTVWGAGFKPGSTIHLNGLEGGPVEGSGLVGEDGTFQFVGSATGRVDLPLEATDGSGRSAEFEGDEPELPTNKLPSASFSFAPANPDEYPEENPVIGEEVLFDASASVDPDGEVVSWDWDFGDGNEGSGETVMHSYSDPDEYIVMLTVIDNRGATGTISKTLVVSKHVEEEINAPPVADAGPDQIVEITGDAEAEIILDASGSSDPDDDPLTYLWDWESGSASGVNPSVTLDSGTTTITLTVSDGNLTDTDDVIITIREKVEQEEPPIPEDKTASPGVLFEISPQNPVAGEEITFDGSASYDPHGLLISYDWSFGDGESASGEIATHTYEQPGLYTVSLFARDGDGNVYSYTTSITVASESGGITAGSPSVTTPASGATSDDSGSSAWIWIVIIIVIVFIAGVGLFILRRRASARS